MHRRRQRHGDLSKKGRKVAARNDDICDVPGIRVGHDTRLDTGTGCTVVLCEWPALGAVDVRGGAPATKETDLLDPRSFMREVHAIVLAGGSAFGLDAATGVMRVLEERGVGFDAGPARVPIVPAAALFDLGVGHPGARPDADAGRRAAESAGAGPIAQGTVGAGTGATVGKLAGPQLATKGGVGSASAELPGGHVLGALVAVNALGDIYDEATGRIVAGTRRPDGTGWLGASSAFAAPSMPSANNVPATPAPGTNTTLAVIATNAPWSKADLTRLAQMAHTGLARAIRPAHTPLDGDIVFALSTAREQPATDAPGAASWPFALAQAGALAAATLSRAVVRAVRAATALHGIPAAGDLPFATHE